MTGTGDKSQELEGPSYRTVAARQTSSSIVKPGELIDVAELTPLTLLDRRSYNLLLAEAWDRIGEDIEHSILKSKLHPDTSNTNNDNLDASIGRLMGSRVRLSLERDGIAYTRSVPLLETIDAPVRGDGRVYYRFPRQLREVILESRIFARLQTSVMFALSSKYSLALYEMVQKRGNLQHQIMETFTLEQLRTLLGVHPDKLREYKNFKLRALAPAVAEVNALASFGVTFKENKTGKWVTSITLHWWRKDEQELREAYRELESAKVGRKVRLKERKPKK